MTRMFETRVLLPDGRHTDWRLMARVERDLKAHHEKWKKDVPRGRHTGSYEVTVTFPNGKFQTDSVSDAREHVMSEGEEVTGVTLAAWSGTVAVNRCLVFLYPPPHREGIRPQDGSRVEVEGTERTEVYGLAEVIKQYTDVPPGDLPQPEPRHERVIDGGNASSTFTSEVDGGTPWSTPAPASKAGTQPVWWRRLVTDHLPLLIVTVVGTVVAGLILYALTGSG